MKSMTGYGSSSFQDENISIETEIRSVNSRFLELKINLPRELYFLEIELNKLVKRKINRGKVNVYIYFNDKRNPEMELDESRLKAFWDIHEKAKKVIGTTQNTQLSRILAEQDMIRINKQDLVGSGIDKQILDTVNNAVENHQKMALIEGKSMKDFFYASLAIMDKEIDFIEAAIPSHKENMFTKIKNSVEEILQDSIDKQDYKRLLQETAMAIEKADVTEEIVRFRDHIQKFLEIMNSDKVSGKSLAFIIQEMHREINTTGSKFGTTEVFPHILIVKEEVEKCREMIANVS